MDRRAAGAVGEAEMEDSHQTASADAGAEAKDGGPHKEVRRG